VGETSVPPPIRQKQQVQGQSVQTPNVNSSYLNNLFKVVATIFQEIMTQLSGAELEEDRIIAITKNCIKTHEAERLLGFIGPWSLNK
jgi:hypothetical protein